MNSNLFLFYQNLDPLKFKYFVVDKTFQIFNSDIEFLPLDLQTKATSFKVFNNICKSVRLQEIENVVRDLLVNRKISVEEYEGTRLIKRGHPSNYGDFLSICLSGTIIPTVGCVLQDNTNQIEFGYFRDDVIYVTKYMDDDLLSMTYAMTNTYNCIEILYAKDKLSRILAGWGVTATQVNNEEGGCTAMMKKFLDGNYRVEKFRCDDVCVIDIEQFDLVDFGCTTMQGKRLLNQWIRSPTTSVKEINKRLDMTEAFSEINISLEGFSDLKRISHKIGIRRVTIGECVKLYQTICEIENLESSISGDVEKYKIRKINRSNTNITNTNSIKNNIIEELYQSFVIPLQKLNEIFGPLRSLIVQKIDLNSDRVLENVNEELARLGSKRRAIYEAMLEEYEDAKKDYPRVKFQNNYFRISRTEYREDELKRCGYSCVSVLKNGVYFMTSRLEKLRKELEEVENESREAERREFEGIRTEMMGYVNSIEIYNFIIALMDVYKTFSIKVRLGNYCRPIFSEDKYQIEGFFHPLLEQRDYVTNDIDFTGNKIICDDEFVDSVNTMGADINQLRSETYISDLAENGCVIKKGSVLRKESIGKEENVIINPNVVREDNINNLNKTTNKKVCVLTGPNMGGKSTVLKSLSIVSLYAQIGCYVPATSAVLPVFDRIFLRVGARDYSSRGLSTFMVEMIDLRKILCSATNKSLILIDELGRGTSAIDGLSLVMAVKEYLAQLGAWTVMATHFSEVGDNSTFNIKMTVSDSLLTYKIREGIADTSFAINVAKLAGFPDSVVQSTTAYIQDESLEKF